MNKSKTKGKNPYKSGNGRKRSGKPNYKGKDFSNGVTDEYKPSNGHNDVSWYTPDQQILNDVARLPYSIPTGMPFSRPITGQGTAGSDMAIPGILTQHIMPTFGYSSSPNDPVNVAAQGIYSFVRHLNSGSRNYDPVDMMIYIGALDSVYSIISWATRLYATICSYAQGNRYLPRLLFEAQHCNFQDFADNMVQFRAKLNQRIAKASQLMVPNVMPLFERHRWLFSNYYIEGDTIKDQIYMYAPVGFYKFDLDSDGAGMLKAVSLRSRYTGSLTVNDLMQLIDDMLDPIIQDEDFNIMSGDIFKAYGNNIVTYSMVPDMIAMNFTYDENVLLQFKNSKSKHVALDSNRNFIDNFFDVHQDTTKSYLVVENPSSAVLNQLNMNLNDWDVCDASATSRVKAIQRIVNYAWTRPTLLTSPHSDPDAAENMVMTRGTMAAEIGFGASADLDTYTMAYGSEWYDHFTITSFFRNRNTMAWNISTMSMEQVVVIFDHLTDTPATFNLYKEFTLRAFTDVSKFKYHPEVSIVNYITDDNTVADNRFGIPSFFEIDNYTVQGYQVIKSMHDAALLGEYNIPRIALLPT